MDFPPPFQGFPHRENCDLNNPYQAFLWMLVALPGQNGGALIMPIDYMQLVSKRLWDLGARPVAEPTLEWVAPTATEPNWMTSAGKWVPAGIAPIRDDRMVAGDILAQMAHQQKAELFAVLQAWEAGEEIPDTPAGLVSKTLSDAQRAVVLELLRAEHDIA